MSMFKPATKFSSGWLIAAVFGVISSLGSLYWLMSLRREANATLGWRLGFACAVYCVLAVGVCCWGAMLAYFARTHSWSPKTCRLMGITFLVPLALEFSRFRDGRFANLTVAMVGAGTVAGFICQKLTYPRNSTEELNAPEPPLSIFSN